jgi:hypothetical protein
MVIKMPKPEETVVKLPDFIAQLNGLASALPRPFW